MTIYILLYVAIWLLGIIPYVKRDSPQSKKIFLFISFLLMTLVVGLRGRTVGEDTNHYLNTFHSAKYITWQQMFTSTGLRTEYYTDQYGWTDTIESGYLILCKLIHYITENDQIYLLIIAGITFYLVAKFIYDNAEKVFLPSYIVLCDFLFIYSFNGIRQVLAISIAIQAYTFLRKNKLKTAIFVILLASLIHNTAIVCLTIIPLMRIKPKKEFRSFKYAMFLAFTTPMLIYAFRHAIVFIFPRYAGYFTQNYWTNKIGGSVSLWILELLFIFIMYKFRFKNTDNSFQLSAITLNYLALEVGGLQISALGRLSQYYRAFLILFFPSIMHYFVVQNRKYVRLSIYIILGLLYFSYASVSSRNYSFFLS